MFMKFIQKLCNVIITSERARDKDGVSEKRIIPKNKDYLIMGSVLVFKCGNFSFRTSVFGAVSRRIGDSLFVCALIT